MRLAPEKGADPADFLGFRAARQICKRHAKSLYFASFFLSPAKRRAVHAAYAFCRMVGEVVCPGGTLAAEAASPPTTVSEACCGASELDQTVGLLRERLDDVYQGRLELPKPEFRSESQHALYAFARTVARYQIPQQYVLDLIDGYRADRTVRRYATWARLEQHCDHTGGVLGLIASAVLGVTSSAAPSHAVAMGNAMRLTTILRDLKDDWRRGRLYLPLEDMVRFGYSEKDLAAGVVNAKFVELMRFEIARARELYRAGAEGLCLLADDGSRLAASAIAVAYAGILDAIERRGYDVFSRRARLTTGQYLRRLPLAWRLSRRREGEALPPVFAVR
jgi:phytoene synthase